MSGQLAEQIAEMKQKLGYGQVPGNQGTASSGWGLGTTPYAVNPAPAPNSKPTEERQGDKSLKDTKPTDFEPLYAPQDLATGTYDTRVKGKLDLTQTPERIEEIRSAPETQQALTQYYDIVSTYVDSEESAIQREEVPLQYQELVKQYFDQLQKESKPAGKGSESEGKGKAKQKGKDD